MMELTEHAGCRWEQIGPCVYCAEHHTRLYNGGLPADRRPPPCASHDWDKEQGLGFYVICRTCGEREWCE